MRQDRDLMLIYGSAGVPTSWIVNLIDRQVEVYSGSMSRRLPFSPGVR